MAKKLWLSLFILILSGGLVGQKARAQSDSDQRYTSPKLGLTFSYPTGWEVEQIGNALITADPVDIVQLASGQPPDGLVIRVYEGDRASFGLTETQSLPELLATVSGLGTAKTTTVNDFQALRADKADNSGGAIAIRIDQSRWALIVTQSTDWANDTPLFEQILATFVFGPEGYQVSKNTPIKYGAKIHQTFASGQNLIPYVFQAKIGELVTITMVADKDDPLDPALVLVGTDDKVVAQNDDSLNTNFGLTNARIVNFPIPKSGTYTIKAIRSTNVGSGFTLTLDNKPTQTQ